MKTGDLLLVRRKFNWKRPISYLSSSIRWWTDFYWNHTETILVEDGIVFTVGAHQGGVKKQLLKYYLNDKDLKYQVVELPELTNEQVNSIVGRKYDVISLVFFQVIFQGTRKLFGKGIWIGKKDEKAEDDLYCSEAHGYLRELQDSYKMSTRELVEELAPEVFKKYRL